MNQDDLPQPLWTNKIPRCSVDCQHFDGKRCKLMGFPPDSICEPEVIRLVSQRDKLITELRGIADAYANDEPISAQWAEDAIALYGKTQ